MANQSWQTATVAWIYYRFFLYILRAGIHCQSSEKEVDESRSKNPAYRTWKPWGEWLRGVIHREAQGQVAEWGDL